LTAYDRDDPRTGRMTATSRAQASGGHAYRRRSGALAVVLLAALIGVWIGCWASTPSASADALARPLCLDATPLGCAPTQAISATNDEAEEPEEEAEEGGEDAATATAEVEAEEASSEEGGSGSLSAAQGTVVLSHLRLTAQATVALAHHRPLASVIDFSCTLSAPAEVRVTLVKQATSHNRTRWVALPDSLSFSAKQGRASRALTGHNRLSPGRYRLTVKPAGGRSRAIYLSARV
jgi:hypothetical protein